MRLVAFILLCFTGLSASAATAPTQPPRSLTVLVNFEGPHSDVSLTALRLKLQSLLAPAGILPDLKLRSDLTANPQFSELVVFQMKGSCSMDGPSSADPNMKATLASAYESNGEILHFGEVECDRVRQCLERITKGRHPDQHQKEYGDALGIVVAHEIYHMIAGVKKHTHTGLTKASLSAEEILDSQLELPDMVRQAMRRTPEPELP